jgi:hypothetical protein
LRWIGWDGWRLKRGEPEGNPKLRQVGALHRGIDGEGVGDGTMWVIGIGLMEKTLPPMT